MATDLASQYQMMEELGCEWNRTSFSQLDLIEICQLIFWFFFFVLFICGC